MNDKEFQFLNINEYHRNNFLGQGVKILIHETDTNSEHAKKSYSIVKQILPKAKIDIADNNGSYSTMQYRNTVKSYKEYDIVTRSNSGNDPHFGYEFQEEAWENGTTLFSSAGNYGTKRDDANPRISKNFWFGVGALEYNVISEVLRRASYSSVSNGTEISGLTNLSTSKGKYDGTSCSCPIVASMFGLWLQRYKYINKKKPTREQKISLIHNSTYKNIYKYGDKTEANKNGGSIREKLKTFPNDWVGYGLFILPSIEKEEKEKRKEEVKDVIKSMAKQFKDVDEDYWAYESIQRIVNKGIAGGYSDNTFRPNNYVTRAQMAAMFSNLIDYIEGK